MTTKETSERLDDLLDDALDDVDGSNMPELTSRLSNVYDNVLEEADRLFTGHERGVRCSQFLCQAADDVIAQVAENSHPANMPFCWVATGGFGRGLLSPGSSTRIVLLHDCDDPDLAAEVVHDVSEHLSDSLPNARIDGHTVESAIHRMATDTLLASDLLETRLLYGERALYESFREAVTSDFLLSNWGRFGEKALAESLATRDPYTRSPYQTELNLKENPGGLRDTGTLIKLADALLQIPSLETYWQDIGGTTHGILTAEERKTLNETYKLLIRMRNELQFLRGPNSDVLSMRIQPALAEAMGHNTEQKSTDEAVADMMHNLFHHTGATNRLLHTVHERFSHIHDVAWRGASRPSKRNLESGFVAVGEKIYNAASPAFDETDGAQRMLKAFLISQRRHIPISHETMQQIQHHTHLIDKAARSDTDAGDIFVDLLGGSVGVGDRLAWMRECGLLQQFLPELKPLVHRVDYSQCYDYTLDEHSIAAVRVIDNLAHTREEDQLRQREILSKIQNDHLLRLALLLHHIDGETIDAADVGRRLGLSRGDADTLNFLVTNQNLLTDLARRHQLDDEGEYYNVAEMVDDPERLRMLYLMTYADCRAMGRLGWFSWLEAHLYEVYNKLLGIVEPGAEATGTPETFRETFIERASEINKQSAAREFAEIIPERYAIEVSVDEALDHLELIECLDEQPATMSWDIDHHTARVWLCSSDVPARFSQVAGVLTAHGLNILNAHAFSLEDETVLDRFIVHKDTGPLNTDAEFWNGVQNTLLESVSGEIDLDDLVAARISRDEHEAPAATRRDVTNIHFDNDSSARFTILDLVTWDQLGLLYSVGKCLSEHRANIEFALISTRMDIAEDVFYINDKKTGTPITSSDRLEELRLALLDTVKNQTR